MLTTGRSPLIFVFVAHLALSCSTNTGSTTDADEPDVEESDVENSPDSETTPTEPEPCDLDHLRETYSGPEETRNVGICRPRLEQCQMTSDGPRYVVIEEEILPEQEICDGYDNDCSGETVGEIWTRHYPDGTFCLDVALRQTNDGGFILATSTEYEPERREDFMLLKSDQEGYEQWRRTFGGKYRDTPSDVLQLLDNSYVIVGSSFNTGPNHEDLDILLIKTDENGSELWSATYDSGGEDYGYSIVQTEDEGFLIAGRRNLGSPLNWDAIVWKIDSSGNELWSQIYGGDKSSDVALSIRQIPGGGFVFVGGSDSFTDDSGGADMWLVEADESGNEIASWFYGIPYNSDGGRQFDRTPGGGFILAGATYDGVDSDGLLVKSDQYGSLQWTGTYGIGLGTEIDYLNSVIATYDGSFVSVGSTTSYGSGGFDGWILKVNSEGDEMLSQAFGESGLDEFHAVIWTLDRNYVAAGLSEGNSGGFRIWLMKFCIE